jgi:hypothetical protein
MIVLTFSPSPPVEDANANPMQAASTGNSRSQGDDTTRGE